MCSRQLATSINRSRVQQAQPLVLPAPSRRALARPLLVHAAAGQSSSLLTSVETGLRDVEARVSKWIAELGGEAVGAASRLQQGLLSLLLLLQRVVRWVQLAAVARQLHLSAQQQQSAFAMGSGPQSSGGSASSNAPDAAGPAPLSSSPQQAPPAAAAAGTVMNFLTSATIGAVEQLRHTLTDASAGIESKMLVIEQTASQVQTTLFNAAQAHSEAVRSNPQMGMWKQPSIEAVLSEEERLRQMVFDQVYAELLQKENKDLSFYAQP